MVAQLQDTIQLADVTEHVNRIADKLRSRDGGGLAARGSMAGCGAGSLPLTPLGAAAGDEFTGEEAGPGGGNGGGGGGWGAPEPPSPAGGAGGRPAALGPEASSASGLSSAAPHGHSRTGAGASVCGSAFGGGALGPDVGYGALAAAADTLDDKLAVVVHKRRCAGSAPLPSITAMVEGWAGLHGARGRSCGRGLRGCNIGSHS
jgi:hypothetical protein